MQVVINIFITIIDSAIATLQSLGARLNRARSQPPRFPENALAYANQPRLSARVRYFSPAARAFRADYRRARILLHPVDSYLNPSCLQHYYVSPRTTYVDPNWPCVVQGYYKPNVNGGSDFQLVDNSFIYSVPANTDNSSDEYST